MLPQNRQKLFAVVIYSMFWLAPWIEHVKNRLTLPFKKFGQFSFGVYLLHYEMFNVVYWFENTVVLKYPIMIIILELIISFTAGMIFFYLIENPMMNIGILIIKCLPEQSNGNIFQDNSTYSTKHLISVIKILFIFLFYFFSFNYFRF